MTEGHDNPASGRPMSTGEFRAARDISASTAQFRAFAEDRSEFARDPEFTAPGRSPAQIAMLVALVIVVLAVIALIAYEMKG